MDFEPSEDHARSLGISRRFVTETLPELSPHPLDFALGAHAALGSSGLFAERSTVATVLSVRELSAGSASLGAVAASGWLFTEALLRHGGQARASLTEDARSGTVIGSVALGDPRHGDCRAIPVSGGFRLDGTLHLVANAPVATHAVVVVAGPDAGFVVLCLDATTVEARRIPPTTGIGFQRLPRCALDLTGVELDAESVLASGEDARAAARALIDARRILTAALALGLAERATARALAHVAHVARRGTRPAQSTEFILADLATELAAATLAVTRAAWLRDAGQAHTLESAVGKLLATRAATRITHGALGVVSESGAPEDLRSAYLDARSLEMQDGADAVQEDTIASVMLGER